MKNTPLRLLQIMLEVTCCILPQITQKIICENLRLKDYMQVVVIYPHNQQYVNF